MIAGGGREQGTTGLRGYEAETKEGGVERNDMKEDQERVVRSVERTRRVWSGKQQERASRRIRSGDRRSSRVEVEDILQACVGVKESRRHGFVRKK